MMVFISNRKLHVSACSGHHQVLTTFLLSCSQANLYDIYHCCVYSEKLLMLDRGTVRNT